MKIQTILLAALIMTVLSNAASAGCGKWVVRDNTDFLDDPAFDEAVMSSTGASSTVASPANQNAAPVNEESVAGPVAEKQDPIADVSGKWLFELQPSLGSSLNLILIQNGDRLMGSGTLNEKSTKIPVTASGSISGDSLELDAKTVVGDYVNQISKSYQLDLIRNNATLQGSYELYEGEGLAETGNTTAVRSGS